MTRVAFASSPALGISQDDPIPVRHYVGGVLGGGRRPNAYHILTCRPSQIIPENIDDRSWY